MGCDTACARIARPAGEVFAFVADPGKLSLWSFGTWRVEIDDGGLIRGTSIGDGAAVYVRIEPHPDLGLVDYLIGADPADLKPRVFIRVADGPTIGGGNGECLLTMTALRAQGMDDDRWAALQTAHAFEVGLIKAAVESGYDHRRPGA